LWKPTNAWAGTAASHKLADRGQRAHGSDMNTAPNTSVAAPTATTPTPSIDRGAGSSKLASPTSPDST